METNVISYPESENTIKIENAKSVAYQFRSVANLNQENSATLIHFRIDTEQIGLLIEQANVRRHLNVKRNDYCVTVIKNLIKKNNSLQLSLQLSEKLITEDEFDTEIDSNPDKYVIQIGELESPMDLHIIGNIVSNIGQTFTTDEISELFSIDPRSISNGLKAIGLKS